MEIGEELLLAPSLYFIFNDLLGELDNFYRLNYCIFAFAVGNTVMTE